MIYIEDIQPSTAYQLRVKASTSAGNVMNEYDFVTLDHTGGKFNWKKKVLICLMNSI